MLEYHGRRCYNRQLHSLSNLRHKIYPGKLAFLRYFVKTQQSSVLLGMPAYLKSSARYEDLPRFKEELANELACLFRFTEGRGLVLHAARERMEYVADCLETELEHI